MGKLPWEGGGTHAHTHTHTHTYIHTHTHTHTHQQPKAVFKEGLSSVRGSLHWDIDSTYCFRNMVLIREVNSHEGGPSSRQ